MRITPGSMISTINKPGVLLFMGVCRPLAWAVFQHLAAVSLSRCTSVDQVFLANGETHSRL